MVIMKWELKRQKDGREGEVGNTGRKEEVGEEK